MVPLCERADCENAVEKSSKGQWKMYCSPGCRGKDNSLKSRDKARSTTLAHYGVDNPAKSTSIRQKMKDTMVDRYGVEYTLQSPELLAKRNNTMIDLYGNEHALLIDQFIDKKNLTNESRYGDANIWNTDRKDEFIDKKKQTCLDKFGVEYAVQSPEVQKNRQHSTLLKYGKLHTSQLHLSDETLLLLDDVNWLTSSHDSKSLIQISKELGISHSHLHKRFVQHGIPIKQYNISEMEREIKLFLNSYGIDTVQSDRSLLGNREIDLYSNDFKIGIECNGTYWHSELHGKDKNYHNTKLKDCAIQGVRLIHISDIQWSSKASIVKSRLLIYFGKVPRRIHARKCHIDIIDTKTEREFLNTTHLQGYSPSTICLGLYNGTELVSVMSFSTPRYSKKYSWELIRYSVKLDTIINGGASKLFTHFVDNYKSGDIISYSATDWNTGSIYKTLGFVYTHTSPPNYQYFLSNNPCKLYSRDAFQKHKLSKLLAIFDPLLTEWQNMQNNGYDRIWDCGNDVWAFKQLGEPN